MIALALLAEFGKPRALAAAMSESSGILAPTAAAMTDDSIRDLPVSTDCNELVDGRTLLIAAYLSRCWRARRGFCRCRPYSSTMASGHRKKGSRRHQPAVGQSLRGPLPKRAAETLCRTTPSQRCDGIESVVVDLLNQEQRAQCPVSSAN
jgi:hypothetical protein